MVNARGGTHAPVDVIGFVHAIRWAITFITLTQATAATGFTTAVIVGNHIAPAIHRVTTGSDPCDRGHFSSRRAGVV